MKSRYEMRVVDLQTGEVMARWPPGLQSERDLVADVVAAGANAARGLIPSLVASVRSKGVGWFKGEDAVSAAVQSSLYEANYDAVMATAVRGALEGAMRQLKSSVKP